MIHKMRNRGQQGFTLIELLIVVAIIGIIAAMLIPNLLDALQKGKQKRTVADERNTGTAWMAWLVDQVGASAAGTTNFPWGMPTYAQADLQTDLDGSLPLPNGDPGIVYLQTVPIRDGWGSDYIYYRQATDLLARRVMAIQSIGQPIAGGEDVCNDVPNSAQQRDLFDARQYDCDIIWADGFFVQAPAGKQQLLAAPAAP